MNRYLVRYRLSYDTEYDAAIIATKNPLYGLQGEDYDEVDSQKLYNRDIQILSALDDNDDLDPTDYYIEIEPMNNIVVRELVIDENINQSRPDSW